MTNIKDVKVGDKFTFLACYFQVPGWMDDQPCVLLSPVLKYDECMSADSTIEDALIDLVVEGYLESQDEDSVEESLNWAGKSIKSIQRAVSRSLKAVEKPYKSVYSEIIKLDVEIVLDEDGELHWKELERIEI